MFSAIFFSKENNVSDSLFASPDNVHSPSQMGSILKGKNLLLVEYFFF